MSLFSRLSMLPSLLVLAGTLCVAQAANPGPNLSGPPSSGGVALPGLSASLPGESVTVRAGDTAYSLARAHGLTVDALLALNGLGSADLKVGQVLRVREDSTYSVQRGDTLYSLARRSGATVDGLLALNGLKPDVVLEVGQVLKVPGTVAAVPDPGARVATATTAPTTPITRALGTPAPVVTPAPAPVETSALPTGWKDAALALLGTPYVFGGSTASGLDCSGFVLRVFSPLGVPLPRRSADQANTGVPVTFAELQPGDLVFFDTVGRGEVTHVGIYLGDDQFVNANSYRGKVTVDRLLNDAYWSPRLLSARRVLPPAVYGMGR